MECSHFEVDVIWPIHLSLTC